MVEAMQDAVIHGLLDLKQDSIRVIEVLPQNDDGTIECRIRHTTTEAKYVCVSYVWGPEVSPRTIRLKGKLLQVRKNLWDFLDVLSSGRCFDGLRDCTGTTDADSTSTTRPALFFWIDALCIDQDNNGERNHQVQQMGKIFANAQFVIA